MATQTTIPDHFVVEWDTNWRHTAQQKDQRLEGMTDVATVNGESRTFNLMEAVSSQEITARLQATAIAEDNFRKRWVFPTKWDAVSHLDEFDAEQLGQTVLPTSATMRAHMAEYYRDCDRKVIAALGGNATEGTAGGNTGTATIALPAGQKIVDGATGMSVAKLLAAKDILGANEAIDPGDTVVFLHNQAALTDLLTEEGTTSADYAAIKALVHGEIDYFMGAKFVRSEQLPVAVNIASCYMYVKRGVVLGKGSQATKMSIRDDQNEAIQIRTKWRHGAVRLEEELVVEIDFDQTAA